MPPARPQNLLRSFHHVGAWVLVMAAAVAVVRDAAAEAEKPLAAVLVLVDGPVHVRSPTGEERPASFGDRLQGGDVVATGTGGQANLIFPSGQIIELGANSRMTLRATTRTPKPHPGTQVVAEVSQDLMAVAQARAGSEGLSALPELRRAGQELDVLYPRRSLVPDRGLEFAWTPVDDVLEYRLDLQGPGPARGTRRLREARWVMPEDVSLPPGSHWTWSVAAISPEGTIRSPEVAFEVASDSLLAVCDQHAERLRPLLESDDARRADAARFLLGRVYRRLGFYNDAIRQLETLVERHPRPELLRELGELYRRVGRYESAAEAFRSALRD